MVNFILFILGVVGIILLGTVVFLVQIVRKPLRKESLKKYFLALAIGLDQLGGSIIYGLEDWCISSVAYFDAENGKNIWFMKLINFLFNDKEHCKNSFENEFKKLGVKPIR
nr:hypothetical protein [Malaciobacter halophilus]